MMVNICNPALRRLWQDYCEFEVSLGYIAKLHLNIASKTPKRGITGLFKLIELREQSKDNLMDPKVRTQIYF
jgi:hypothetical protein